MWTCVARWLVGSALLALLGCASPGVRLVHADPAAPHQPEAATAPTEQRGVVVRREAVVTAHPLASDAGLRMLQAGGSAVDAAIAAQLVLGLVEPQSSGIGGGAFLLHWDGQQLQSYDGRETAPAGVSERLLLDAAGQPLAFHTAAVGGRAVGVPGVLRMLALAHRRHGRLPWAMLFEPAIDVAERGFEVGPRLHALLVGEAFLRRDAAAARLYYPHAGAPLAVGERLRNPAMASLLRTLAQDGAEAFYRSPVAQHIATAVQAHASNPGLMTEADLAAYQAVERPALCADWRRWRLCGMAPPSSGPIALLQILKLLDAVQPPSPADLVANPTPEAAELQPGAPFLHRYQEAARLAYADRAQFVADPAFVDPPAGGWASLLDAGYLADRARLIGARALTDVPAGHPGRSRTPSAWAPQLDGVEHGTSHLSIVDAEGHAVAMTTTIEDQFGARLLVDGGTGLPGGFLLNNQLTDFAFAPTDAQGRPVANRVEPGKRPRSSMSPLMVFDRASGALELVAGSPGGVMIPHYVAKALLGTLAWGLDAQAAAALPNFGTPGVPLLLESERFAASTVSALRGLGHRVIEAGLSSGIHLLQRLDTPSGPAWLGAADPRREGQVRGD